MNTITISKSKIRSTGGVVVLPIEEYRKLAERAVPTYYLTGKAAKDLDKLAKEGLRDYEAGRTIKASSIKEALRTYGKNREH